MRAKALRESKELMSEDLPTLLRPMIAISGNAPAGICPSSSTEVTNSADTTLNMLLSRAKSYR